MVRSALVCVAALVVLAPAVARARGGVVDPDTTAARRHFEAGLVHYQVDDFRGALVEFEAARRLKPLPAFDYNIGRCHDRLEEYEAAVRSYRRYLDEAPGASDAPEVRARIGVLEERLAAAAAAVVVAPPPLVAPPPPPPAPAPSTSRRRLTWGLVGGGAAVALVVTAVVLASVLGGGTTYPAPSLGSIRGN
jgi:hypothetical protein